MKVRASCLRRWSIRVKDILRHAPQRPGAHRLESRERLAVCAGAHANGDIDMRRHFLVACLSTLLVLPA